MSEQIPDVFFPSQLDYLQKLNALNRAVVTATRNALPGILTSKVFQMSAGVASYTLPQVAIVGIHQAFLNGVKTSVALAGNVVTATQFVPSQYSSKDELEIFYFI